MSKLKYSKKGLALLFVLSTILIVTVLANVVLAIMSSQSRLTHHQVSRIQAYYSLQGVMIIAMERLRTGVMGTGTFRVCNSGCTGPRDINDADIIFPVDVTISNPNATTGIRTITLTSDYTPP